MEEMNKAFKAAGKIAEKVGIIDAANLSIRVFHRVNARVRRTPTVPFDLIPYMATVALSQEILRFIREADLDGVIWVTEGVPKERNRISMGNYKSNRAFTVTKDETKESRKRYFELAWDFLQYLPILCIKHPDHEADDVIAQVSKTLCAGGCRVFLLSDDTDFLQLPDDIVLWRQVKGGFKKSRMIPPTGIARGERYLDFKSLVGDKSDNVAGVPGIGPVRAARIAATESSMKEWLASAPEGQREHYIRALSLIKFQEVPYPLKIKDTPDVNEDLLSEAFNKISGQSIATQRAIGDRITWSSFKFHWNQIANKMPLLRKRCAELGIVE